MQGWDPVKADSFALPNMPVPPDSLRGIRKKTSSIMRWFAICVDDTSKYVVIRYTCIFHIWHNIAFTTKVIDLKSLCCFFLINNPGKGDIQTLSICSGNILGIF